MSAKSSSRRPRQVSLEVRRAGGSSPRLTGRIWSPGVAADSVWRRRAGLLSAARGISSTATVALDPSTGRPTVYVSGGDGRLYALDAATGNVVWQSVIGLPSNTANDYYDWSSPAVSNGHIFIGVSSQCDQPFVPGGVKEYDQHTGALLATYTSSLPGAPGAGSGVAAKNACGGGGIL